MEAASNAGGEFARFQLAHCLLRRRYGPREPDRAIELLGALLDSSYRTSIERELVPAVWALIDAPGRREPLESSIALLNELQHESDYVKATLGAVLYHLDRNEERAATLISEAAEGGKVGFMPIIAWTLLFDGKSPWPPGDEPFKDPESDLAPFASRGNARAIALLDR